MKRKNPNKPVSILPEGITQKDTIYPKDGCKWDAGDSGMLTFYRVETVGWVLLTLHIRSASRRSIHSAARSYGIRLDTETPVRVGLGPHVLDQIRVYIPKKSPSAAIAKYVELHKKGLSEAGVIRDRISSRRAEGALRRSRGEYSWMWGS